MHRALNVDTAVQSNAAEFDDQLNTCAVFLYGSLDPAIKSANAKSSQAFLYDVYATHRFSPATTPVN